MFARRCRGSRVGGFRIATAALALFLAGCAFTRTPAGDNKAGGAPDPVVLRLANTSYDLERHPALKYFVDRVEELSGRALRIEVVNRYGSYLPDAEQRVVHDVAAGKIDLGWVGTSVFDTLGVTEFQALTAPMLIDNYPLQTAVLDSNIPSTMLASLERIGLDGLAVMADGLRKPIAAGHPLLGPADYSGITFAAFRSQNHADAIRALGATPSDAFGPSLDAGLSGGAIDGFEKGLRIYSFNGDGYLAPYVTANVNLWPHTLAVIANPKAMAELTDSERKWLTQASADAESRSTDLSNDDAAQLVDLCQTGSRFANASEADLGALRQAFEPVYERLDTNAATRAFIDRIEQLKDSTPAGTPLEIPAGCTGPAPAISVPEAPSETAASSVVLDGVYRWTITKDDALAHGLPQDKTPDALALFPTVFTVTMTHRTWKIHLRGGGVDVDDGAGTYTVVGDRVTFDWNGVPMTFAFTIDGDGDLHLDPVPPMNPGDVFIWATNPWDKVG